jgi:hypothetical protein
MFGLVNDIMKPYLRLRMRRIEEMMRSPEEAQERVFRSLLDTAQNTEFGRRYNFAGIHNHEQFARTVPVHDYESLKNDIARMMRGERDVLWPGEINWYSQKQRHHQRQKQIHPRADGESGACHIAGTWDSVALLYAQPAGYGNFQIPEPGHARLFRFLAGVPETRTGDVSAF